VARALGLKPFYGLLGVIAAAGAGWLFLSARDSSPPVTAAPVPVGGTATESAFPGFTMGSDTAPIEVVEWADFQCPACGQFAVLTMHDVRERLIATGRVRWRFRDFPLDIHDKARLAHHAAACAGEQGRFWEMHDQLFLGQSRWSAQRSGPAARTFRDYARAIGLDVGAYEACMEGGRYQARIEASVREGVDFGVNSTPTFIIGDAKVAQALAYDPFRRIIDSLTALKAR
jgi:protein-disulfide isomerase